MIIMIDCHFWNGKYCVWLGFDDGTHRSFVCADLGQVLTIIQVEAVKAGSH